MLTDNIYNEADRNLRLMILNMKNALLQAYNNRMPHFIADYVYDLCVQSNVFYQTNRINGNENETMKNDFISVLSLTNEVIKTMLYLLGIEIPKVM